jgi:UDP-3-O-[3-hydroxymyristoyl] glucosamine N-acyltransferase
LEAAGQGDLTFLFNPKYRDLLASSQAAAVCLTEGDAHGIEMPVLIAERPRLAWARIASLFDKAEQGRGIDASASIASSAVIGDGVAIGPHAVIRAGASIGENTVIGPGAVIGEESAIGSNTTIHANVVVYRRSRIGDECIIHANAVIGADGFGYEFDPEVAALKDPPDLRRRYR